MILKLKERGKFESYINIFTGQERHISRLTHEKELSATAH